MVNACPPQSDPRPNVSNFISNSECKALPGLTAEGLDSLVQVVIDELAKQEPGSNIVKMDRELLSDEDITFARDLSAFIDKKLAEGKKLNLVISGEPPIIGWNNVLEKYRGANISAYYATLACRQVPLCTKIDV